ncbi:hypothetical protein ACNKHR_27895 [Shigella flexneri]
MATPLAFILSPIIRQLLPHGLLPALVLIQGVVFAFASIEMVGTAAGESRSGPSC